MAVRPAYRHPAELLRLCIVRRALANNMVVGTSTGWTKTLSLVGVGYRASVSGTKLVLNLGYSHPIEMDFPKGVTVAVCHVVLDAYFQCLELLSLLVD